MTGRNETFGYDQLNRLLEETDLSGNLIRDYVYFAGKRVGRRDASGTVYSYVTDPLGTTKGIISSSTLCYDADFYPFGGEKVFTNTCAQNYKFTGLERDAESGLDKTLTRMYTSNMGRWLSADRRGGHTGNPQSLNRYAYVLNNPSTLTDPLGLEDVSCTTNEDGSIDCPTIYSNSTADGGGTGGGDQSGTSSPPDSSVSTGTSGFISPSPPDGGGSGGGGGGDASSPGCIGGKKPTDLISDLYRTFGIQLNNCIRKVFGKDASKVPPQTFGNSPAVDTSLNGDQIGAFSAPPHQTAAAATAQTWVLTGQFMLPHRTARTRPQIP